MSVILEALQKARRDDHQAQNAAPGEARVLDAAPGVPVAVRRENNARRRGLLLALVLGSVGATVLLTSLAFYLLAVRLGIVPGFGFSAALRPSGAVQTANSETVAGGGALPVVGAQGVPVMNGAQVGMANGGASAALAGAHAVPAGQLTTGIATPHPVSSHGLGGAHAAMAAPQDLPIAVYRTNQLPPPAPHRAEGPAHAAITAAVQPGDMLPVSTPAQNGGATGKPASGKPALSVGAILWDEEMSSAIVNGRTVKVGDDVDEYIVRQITQSSVVFQRGNEPPVTVRPK